jgi:hypothetical protein
MGYVSSFFASGGGFFLLPSSQRGRPTPTFNSIDDDMRWEERRMTLMYPIQLYSVHGSCHRFYFVKVAELTSQLPKRQLTEQIGYN